MLVHYKFKNLLGSDVVDRGSKIRIIKNLFLKSNTPSIMDYESVHVVHNGVELNNLDSEIPNTTEESRLIITVSGEVLCILSSIFIINFGFS